MYLHKSDFNEILARWMKSDPELWACLSDAEMKILHQRITKEYSFNKIAEGLDSEAEIIHKIFLKIIDKITTELNHEIGVELFIIHCKMENPDLNEHLIPPPYPLIYLN